MASGTRIRILAMLCVTVLSISGCGTGQGADQGQSNRLAVSQENAMGRYMETFYEMPPEINRNGGVNWLDDGSLTVISFGNGLYRSYDEGQTWQQEEADWFPMIQDVYCLSAAMGPDGTVAASCSGKMSEAVRTVYNGSADEDWEGNYCVFGMPDGSIKIVDFGFSQDDGSCIETFVFKEDGRLFAEDLRGKVYEVDAEKENLKELFMAEQSVGCMDFSGDILMAVGHDRLYRYDLREEVLLPQDETADAWIRQALPDGTVSWTGGGYPVAVAGNGEEDVIYLASEDGVYRHVLGGSMMEQVIDGALSTFGDASSKIYRIRVLENQEFLAVYNPSVGLVRYAFDETVPAMPEREIRIYSLEENISVRQAVTAFKRSHADIYVRYEVGMEGENGITAQDALKRLNTQVMAGEGPDVLLLDGLPLDTYIEKGMLQDIGPLMERLEEELFSNVMETFTDGNGAVYAMPLCIRVPLLSGNKETVDGMKDLESIADQAETLRRLHPQGGIFGIYEAESMLRLFGMVSSPAWMKNESQMDQEAVEEFLRQVKRIYDAEQSGAIPRQVERFREEAEEMASYGTDPMERQMETCSNVLKISQGNALAAGGYVEGIQLCLDSVTSVLRTDDRLDYRVFCGQIQNAFFPSAMVGISSGTSHLQEAEDFVCMMFSTDTQDHLYDGFPVNRTSYETHFDSLEENAYNGSMMLLMDDGTEQELNLYWPDQAEQEKFTGYVEMLQTPVITDEQLCGLVYETGKKVLEGELSAEEGAAEIIKKASIYLAE